LARENSGESVQKKSDRGTADLLCGVFACRYAPLEASARCRVLPGLLLPHTASLANLQRPCCSKNAHHSSLCIQPCVPARCLEASIQSAHWIAFLETTSCSYTHPAPASMEDVFWGQVVHLWRVSCRVSCCFLPYPSLPQCTARYHPSPPTNKQARSYPSLDPPSLLPPITANMLQLLFIGAGPHSLATLARLLEPNPDPGVDAPQRHVHSKTKVRPLHTCTSAHQSLAAWQSVQLTD
jgi:hypothetical protein